MLRTWASKSVVWIISNNWERGFYSSSNHCQMLLVGVIHFFQWHHGMSFALLLVVITITAYKAVHYPITTIMCFVSYNDYAFHEVASLSF